MPNKCDPNIYGIDKNDYAAAVWGDALGAPDEYEHSGVPTGGVMAVGSKGKRLDGTEEKTPIAKEPNPDIDLTHSKGDSRAHSKGND